jgi:hypothetical protein
MQFIPLFKVRDMRAATWHYALWVGALKDPDGYRLEFASPTDVPEETTYSAWKKKL